MRIALIFAVLIAIIAVVFAVQNPGYMEITIGTLTFRTLTAIALIITFGIGAVAGILFTLPSAVKSRRRVRVLEKRIAETHRGEPVVEHRVVEEMPADTEAHRRRSLL